MLLELLNVTHVTGVVTLQHVNGVVTFVTCYRSDYIVTCYMSGYIVTCYRSGYIVHLPVPEHMFLLLPRELQQGHAIKVIPVIFSIGINEQATIAER